MTAIRSKEARSEKVSVLTTEKEGGRGSPCDFDREDSHKQTRSRGESQEGFLHFVSLLQPLKKANSPHTIELQHEQAPFDNKAARCSVPRHAERKGKTSSLKSDRILLHNLPQCSVNILVPHKDERGKKKKLFIKCKIFKCSPEC